MPYEGSRDWCHRGIYGIQTSISDQGQAKGTFSPATSEYDQNINTHTLIFKHIPLTFLQCLILGEFNTIVMSLICEYVRRNIFQACLGVTERFDILISHATVERELSWNLPDFPPPRHHDFRCCIFHSLITIYKYVRETIIIKMLCFYRDHTLKNKPTILITELAHGISSFHCNFASWGPPYLALIS